MTKIVVALGAATFVGLLWSVGPGTVWLRLARFGRGFFVVLPFQIFDHVLNALGWRLAFTPEAAQRAPFVDLIRARIAGDGVNYLTPSAQVAGEFVRPGMVGGAVSSDEKIASVVIAKAAQSVAQSLFVIAGLVYLAHEKLFTTSDGRAAMGFVGIGAILAAVCFAVWLIAAEPPRWIRTRFPTAVERSAPVRGQLRHYLARHPVRLAGSTACFGLGYAWGAAEVWLIAYFLGLGLSPKVALCVEFLSNLVDALAFWVPAKIGTQEGGKTAIFAGLGLPADAGFALGLIRHVREILWAGAGLFLYAAHQRRVSAKATTLSQPPPPSERRTPRSRV